MSNDRATIKQLRRQVNEANRVIKLQRDDARLDHREKIVGKSRASRQHTTSRLAPQTTFDEYLDVLIDPENASVPPELQVPGLTQVPSVAWKNKWEILVTADVNGELAALFRPGLGAVYAASDHVISTSMLHPYIESETAGVPTVGYFPPAGSSSMLRIGSGPLLDTWSVPYWDSVPEARAMIDSMVVYQPIAASISATYASAPLNATGRVLAASIPGSQAIAPGNSANADLCMGLGSTQDLSYDSLVTLEDAVSSPVLDGARAIYVPEGQSAADFRPTKYAPSFYAFANAMSGTVGVENGPPCDGDPAQFQANVDQLTSPSALNNVLYDSSGVARNAAAQLALTKGAQRALAGMTSRSCPTLVIFGDGLVAGAQYKVVFTQVLCGVADSRNWSLSRPSVPKSLVSEAHEGAAQIVAHALPKAYPGHTSRSATRAIGKHASSLYHTLVKGWDTVKKYGPALANGAGRLLSEAGYADAAGIMADIGSATSTAELGALLMM